MTCENCNCAAGQCGTGNWSGPLPGDPDNNITLTASPAFGGVDVTWSYPAVNPYAVAYVELYRAFVPDFAAAVQLAIVSGNFFYDKSSSPTLRQQYYWIKVVSVNGTVGAVIGPAFATAKPPIATVIEQLTGQIDSGVLAQALKAKIDQITLNAQDILDEATARIAANTALSNALAQIQVGTQEAITLINQEITNRVSGDSAIVGQVNTIAAANAANSALITQETQARVSAVEAVASSVTALNSQVNNATTGLPATRATLLNDYYTKTGVDSAITSATSTLVSTTALNNTLGSYVTNAALTQSYYTKTQTDSAISSATSTLVSTTALNNALGNYTNTASLQQNYYTKTAVDSAISTAQTTAISSANNNTAAIQQTLQTQINTTNGKVNAIGALYTVNLTVNNLVGGFGVYNSGASVEAGFDVDTFWVGRTQANKRKPFIVSGGVVYIDEAAIERLTFSKLRDESGNFIVENGRVKANYITAQKVTSSNNNFQIDLDLGFIKVFNNGVLRVRFGNLTA